MNTNQPLTLRRMRSTAIVEMVPMSLLSTREQQQVNDTPSPFGDPVDCLIVIDDLAERQGITRAEATRLYLLAHGR